MINVNLNALQKYLNPNKAKLLSKGVSSVVSRVRNLQLSNPAITHESLSASIINEFKKAYGGDCEVEQYDSSFLQNIPSLSYTYEQLKDWNWRYGQTPSFNHHLETRFDWGIMDVYINSTNGLVSGAKIYSDTLFPTMIEDLMIALQGVRYNGESINFALQGVAAKYTSTDCEKYVKQFSVWLVCNI